VKIGPWPFGKNGDTGEGKAISVDGEKSPRGLGMHPPERAFAAVRYQLDKKAAVFKGAVGLNDTRFVVLGSGMFEVYGDGKRLWQSGQMNRDKHGPEAFSIDVTGVSELELRVVADNSNQGLHAVWLEPRLLQRSDTPDK
jgi:alpha-galactosidase